MHVRKLVLVDYLARGGVGHNQIYSLSVANEAVNRGIDVEIWCPTNCSIKSKYAKKIFSVMKPFERMRIIKQMWVRALEFRSLLTRPDLTSEDLILFHTVSHPFFISISLAIFGLKIKPKVVVIMRRGLNEKYRAPYPVILQEIASWFMTVPFVFWLNWVEGIWFATDSDLITRELKKSGLNGVFTLPIPHSRIPLVNKRKDEMVIGYFGGGRAEKGFKFLPAVANRILKSDPHAKFIFQTYLEVNHYDTPDMKLEREKLLKLAVRHPKSFKMTDASLSYSAYSRLMSQCSIILLPYIAERYGKGTSGILAEAVTMGKWIVVPANTWMAAQKQSYEKIAVFDRETPESISNAILSCVVLDSTVDMRHVSNQINRWRAFHNAGNYLKILLKRAD